MIHFVYSDIESMLISFLSILITSILTFKFTVEVAEDDNLPFLDVLLTHEQAGFSTSLYRKKTFSRLYTDYTSHVPDNYEIILVRTLVF